MTDTVAMPLTTCPDCPAVADPDTKVVEHFDGCPVGRALDEMSATDREWFATHPGVDHYYRPLMPGDLGLASLRCIVAAGTVRVHKLDDDASVRYRRLPAVTILIDQDDPSPDALRVAALIGLANPTGRMGRRMDPQPEPNERNPQ